MLKKLFAMTATLFVAGVLCLGTATGAFAVDGDPVPPTAPDSAASDSPAPEAVVSDAAAPSSDGTPDETSPAAQAACIPNSAVSYTYDRDSNSGEITVLDVTDSTGMLCNPFYVTATSWRFTTTQLWPQTRDVVQKLFISMPGVTAYSAPVTCGQGDIYASFYAQPTPPAILNAPSPVAEPPAPAPGAPFGEHFLEDMGFAGADTTSTVQDPSCALSDLSTFAIQPVSVTSTQPSCSLAGSITVGQVGGVDFTPVVRYSIDGTPVSGITTSAASGTHTVTAVALSGNSLEQGANTLADGTAAWTVNLSAPVCRDLTTLALHDESDPATLASTGVNDTGWFVTAGALLAAGIALLAVQKAESRRRRQL